MGAPSGSLEAGLAGAAVALALLSVGFGLTGLVPAWRGDLVARLALAFPALVALALVMTGVHVASGGAFFRNGRAAPLVVAAVAAALAARWAVRRLRGRWSGPPALRELGLAGACCLLVALVWGSPVFRILPLTGGGDIGLHAGWAEQLMNGERLPSALITGDVPNYYPWLYHSLLALVTHLTPGGHAYHGLAALQLLQPVGLAAGLFALGSVVAGRWAGAATVVVGAAAGGWGFVLVRDLDLVMDPRDEGGEAATRYAGDLLFTRSYNGSFASLAPPYPRDVAVALLVAALFLVARGARGGARLDLAAGGVVLGLAGLTQTDAFAVGLLAAAAAAALAARGKRLLTAALLVGPALALFALWAVPLAVSYARLGGFVDTTVVEPVSLPAWAILGSWGVVTPLAAVGAVRAARSFDDPAVRVVVAAVAAGAIAVGASLLAPAVLGGGFETVGRSHRYWPLLFLGLALLAGLGAHDLGARLGGRRPWAAAAAAALLVALALPSPLIASLALAEKRHASPGLERALRGDPDEVLVAVDRAGGTGPCAAAGAVPVRTFAFTGFRSVVVGNAAFRENAARIRWAEIYERIVPQEQRVRDSRLLASRALTREQLDAIVARYGLDVVAVPRRAARADAYRGLDGSPARSGGRRYVVFALGPC